MPAPKNTLGRSAFANAAMAAPAGGMPATDEHERRPTRRLRLQRRQLRRRRLLHLARLRLRASGGYPNCGVSNYCGDTGCNDNQWFGGIYFLGMGRTNATPVKLTSQMPTGRSYPYYPQPADTIMTNRDVNFDFREGVEVRFGSTFTIGDSCSACQSTCGYNTGCGCNSCAPQTTYAWEVAWWGLNDSPKR